MEYFKFYSNHVLKSNKCRILIPGYFQEKYTTKVYFRNCGMIEYKKIVATNQLTTNQRINLS